MGALTSFALLTMGVMQGVQNIQRGKLLSTEAKYNEAVKQQEASVIEESKQVEAQQYARLAGRTMATSIARLAKSGIALKGSPMAVILDTQRQIEMDKAIGQYNLEIQKQFAISEQLQYGRMAKSYVRQGIYQGFTQILTSGIDYGMRSGWFSTKPTTYGKVEKLTGSYSVPAPYSSTRVGRSMYTYKG